MPRLTISERNQTIGMLNSNVNFSIISSIFNCSVKTIRRIKSKYDQHESVGWAEIGRRNGIENQK